MQPSDDAIALVKASEGCQLTAYRDPKGILTIGWGSTGGIREGQTITQQQADEKLVDDLGDAAEQVRSLVTVPLSQGQFDALTDFVFNLGAGRLRNSTLLQYLNRGQYDQACAQFKFWIMSAGVPEPGLVTRRAADAALFNKQVTSLANVIGSVA